MPCLWWEVVQPFLQGQNTSKHPREVIWCRQAEGNRDYTGLVGLNPLPRWISWADHLTSLGLSFYFWPVWHLPHTVVIGIEGVPGIGCVSNNISIYIIPGSPILKLAPTEERQRPTFIEYTLYQKLYTCYAYQTHRLWKQAPPWLCPLVPVENLLFPTSGPRGDVRQW